MAPCPDPLALAAPSEEALAHAAACGRCRSLLMDLAAPEEGLSAGGERAALKALSTPKRAWAPLAAAAGLLIAAGFWWQRAEVTPGPGRPPELTALLPAPAESTPTILGQAGSLTLKPGSRVQVTGPEATLLAGALWLEDPGEALTLRAAGASIRVDAAVLLLELRSPGFAGTWIKDARAGEEEARLALLSGEAGIGDVLVKAGQEVPIRSGAPGAPQPIGAVSWRGDQGWQRLPGLPLALQAGGHVLAHPDRKDAYVWEAVLRRADPAAAAALRFVAGDRGWQTPLGVPWTGSGPLRVRVEAQGGWLRLLAGRYEILRKPLTSLQASGGNLEPAPADCGLQVWGGSLEVLESRWRDTP